MKIDRRKSTITLGEFIASVYDVCGSRKAVGILRLAIKTGLIEFRGPQIFVFS
jgi:hypothetical protein